jgi:hypothetical protein
MDGHDEQDKRNDERGVMNERQAAHHSSFRIHRASFLPYPAHPVHPCELNSDEQ